MTIDQASALFFSRIGTYNGFLFQTSTIFDTIIKNEIEFSTKRNMPDFKRPILGNKLVYQNPITTKYVFAHTYFVNDKNIEETLENLKIHYFNFVVAQCYEAFETFLKDIISAYLLTLDKNSSLIPNSIKTDDYEICRETISSYSFSKNKYNKKLFQILYSLNPKIEQTEINNFLRFNFKEWFIVFTEIRHSIVHSNSKFKMNKIAQWSGFQKELLTQLFLNNYANNTSYISTIKEFDYILRIIGQHGQIVSDCLIR